MGKITIWIFRWLGIGGIIGATVAGLFWIGKRDTQWSLCLNLPGKCILATVCALNSLCILLLGNHGFLTNILLGGFAGSLLTAAVMDLWEQMVYRFVWWIAGTIVIATWSLQLYQERTGEELLTQLILYIVLQQVVFAHFYGRADCHAFSVCAAGMTVLGMDFSDYTVHMALTFVGLTVIQFAQGNVTRKGRLRHPAPLVPYIVTAFWICVTFPILKACSIFVSLG